MGSNLKVRIESPPKILVGLNSRPHDVGKHADVDLRRGPCADRE